MRDRENDVEIERDVEVLAHDGATLLTDVFHPVGVAAAPTILERTAYGRAMIGGLTGPELAARGYRYVVQASRGTDGSGGTFSFFAEAPDGRDTADWIAEQPWFDGNLGSYGMSYMGFTQWALASTRPPHLKAMSVALATTQRAFSWFAGGALALEVMIPWNLGALGFNKADGRGVLDEASTEAIEAKMAELRSAFDHLPLGDVLRHVAGEDLDLYQEQLAHPASDDPHWKAIQLRPMLADWDIPVLLIDGWQDYPLPGVLADYDALSDADVPVWLRIGAGGHMGAGGEGALLDAPLEWFDLHFRSSSSTGRHRRVSLYVQGDQPGWQEHPDWPPSAEATAWYLQPDGGLGTDLPPDSPPDSHPYDPADPTPSVGGIGMLTGGIVDNAALEARPDVLVYTSEPLAESLLLTGAITATIELGSSLDHTDVFVRLCDVDADGRSANVCDGLQRFTPATIERDSDGAFTAVVELWPTAHRFAVGHRIRVQVSGGAHPVYGRNLGTDEPLATATTLRSAVHTVFHDPVHPSKVVLPHAAPGP